MKGWTEIVKNVSLLTQFGLSFVTPLLLCLFFCKWLCDSFGFDGWIYFPGFIFGLGGSAGVAYKLYLQEMRKNRKSEKEHKKKVSFNRHL